MAGTVLVAHRSREVRERFASAFAGGDHRYVAVEDEAGLRREAGGPDVPLSLVLIDLGLAGDATSLVRSLTQGREAPPSVVVFASTITGADQVAMLAGLGIAGFMNDHAAGAQILPSLAPFLFPDNFNRRASPRVSLGVPVSYRAGQTIAGAVTLDVGKGGLAVRTMSPLPAGTPLQVKFRLPGSGADLEATARVAWSDRRVGMGLQFVSIAPTDQARVDAFVDAHQARV
ncbi:MAG: PilZ domain-containing protein [Vicinamibacterales bacterium]